MIVEQIDGCVSAEVDDKYMIFQADTVSGALPVPADFQISKGTRVLVITGPNTGGKTICLKSVGLAAMMAKSGKPYVTYNFFCYLLL